jgi:hypothetical protein
MLSTKVVRFHADIATDADLGIAGTTNSSLTFLPSARSSAKLTWMGVARRALGKQDMVGEVKVDLASHSLADLVATLLVASFGNASLANQANSTRPVLAAPFSG